MTEVTPLGGSGRCAPLDGVRGLAVAAVVAFHLGYLPGGFLGVDAFFVLSGFLVTGMLLADHGRGGRSRLRTFWAGRARRLLPALLLVMLAIAAYAHWGAAPADRAEIRASGLATLAYLANWHAIAAGTNYFDQFRAPSPLAHMWSLSIEEQFYVVWPLVVLTLDRVGRRRTGRRRLDALLVLTAGGALASASTMILLAVHGAPLERIYEGTDTRVASILVGATLAVSRARSALRPAPAVSVLRADLGAGAGLGHEEPILGRPPSVLRAGLGVAARTSHEESSDARVDHGWRWAEVGAGAALGLVALSWALARGADRWLYRGGLPLLAVLVAVVIAHVTRRPDGLVGRALTVRPLPTLGRVSYGLYLWHWPVIVVFNPARVGFEGPALAVLRLAVSLLLTAVSYHLVEQPVRTRVVPPRLLRIGAVVAPVACLALLLASTVAVPTPFDHEEAAVAAHPMRLVVAADPPTTTTQPSTRSVLVVGDSGAYYLGQGMQRVAPRVGAAVFDRGTIGCGIARSDGRGRYPDGRVVRDPHDCGRYLDRWTLYLLALHPDIAVLTLASTGDGARMVGGRWRSDCDPVHDDWLRRQAEAALQTLGRTGARVFLTTTPPALRPYELHPDTREVDCRNAALRSAAASVPGTGVVDLSGWVCPGGRTCRMTDHHVVLRPDLVHFAGPGADLAGRWLLQRLLDPRTRSG